VLTIGTFHDASTSSVNLRRLVEEKEQIFLSVIGDGSDDNETAERLGISRFTSSGPRLEVLRDGE